MFFRNLLRRKARSLLTMAGIAIGVAAMIALGALAAGLASGYQALASGSQADFVLSQPDAYDLTMSAVDEHIGDELLAMPEVRQVTGTIFGNVAVSEGASYFFVFGHEPGQFAIEHFRVIEGDDLTASGVRGRPLLLGKRAAESLELEVGETMRMTGATFRIVGLYETGDAFEDGGALISLSEAQTLLQKHRLVSAYYVKLKDTALSERFRERIGRRYPNLQLSTASEFGDRQQMVEILKGMGWVVGALAILVGGVGMTNTVLMSVFERTREIGVLRAVGWRRSRVLRLILNEALILAVTGTALGILLGVALVYAVRGVPLFGILQGELSAGLFLRALAIAGFLGVAGGLYPAWRASQLTPLEAMRADGGEASKGKGRLKLPFGGMTVKNLLRRKTRTALTLIAIGIGIGAVFAMGGITVGFTSQFNTMAASSNAQLMAVEAGISDTGYSAISERIGARIAAYPQVAHVSGIVFWALTNVEQMPIFILFGYHPQEPAIAHFKIVEGERLTGSRQAILGRTAANAMGSGIGDTVRLGDSAFRVVGIFETGIGWEEMGAVVARRDAQIIAGKPRQVSMYAIELQDPSRAEEVAAELDEAFPEINVAMTSEFAESLPDMASMQTSITALAVLLALVGSVAMTNTILMSVLERTREIGVLRALGWSRRRVLTMVLKESLLISGLGGLAGIALGLALPELLDLVPAIRGLLEASFPLALYLQAMAVALGLGALGGLYPAWRATKMQPIEALRYE